MFKDLKENKSLPTVLVAFGLFALWALIVRSGQIPAVDQYVMSRFPRLGRDRWEPIAVFASYFGSFPKVALGVSLPALVLLIKAPRQARLLILVFSVSLVSGFVKELVARNRPEAWLVGFMPAIDNNLSFPSGHTALAAGVYGCIILLAWRLSPSRLVRATVTVILAALILAVAVSRVYLGVHYPTDVLGGFLLGLGWLALLVLLDGLIDRTHGSHEDP